LGRGSKPTLQYRKRKADGSGPLVVSQCFGSVKLLAHIIGNLFIEACLSIGELIGNGVSNPLWKKMCSVEFKQVLFDHPAHEVGNICRMRPVTKASFEAVAVKQRHEELEVSLLAIVRCCRH